MDLARGVVEAEAAAGEDRHHVLLVVDVRDGELGGEAVDVVGEGLVADAREAVSDEARRDAGDLEREVHGVEEGDGGA